MAIAEWPTLLPPCPLLEGFGRRPKTPFSETEMDNGLARRERRFRVVPIVVPVAFIFDAQQYDIFADFCMNDLNGYANWFMLSIDGPGGIVKRRVQFVEATSDDRLGGGHWKVTGQLRTLSNF